MSFPSRQALLIFLLLLLLILGFQPAGAQSRATCPLLTFCILWSAFPWAKAFSYDPPSLALCHLAWRELSWCSCTCVSGTLGHHRAELSIFRVAEGGLWGSEGQFQGMTQNFRSVRWIFWGERKRLITRVRNISFVWLWKEISTKWHKRKIKNAKRTVCDKTSWDTELGSNITWRVVWRRNACML